MARERSLTAHYTVTKRRQIKRFQHRNAFYIPVQINDTSCCNQCKAVDEDPNNERHCPYWRAAKQQENSECKESLEMQYNSRQIYADGDSILQYWGICDSGRSLSTKVLPNKHVMITIFCDEAFLQVERTMRGRSRSDLLPIVVVVLQ